MLRDKNGDTPLHEATRGDGNGAVRVLLEHGALVDIKNNDGHTPLARAANFVYEYNLGRSRFVETAKCLIAYGASV